MAVTNNNIATIDLPSWEVLQPFPAATAAGACMCNDKRGTGRYIYVLLSATSFWRYDVQANTYQQLASPPGGTFGNGTCMTYDPSNSYVWLLLCNATLPTFQYYNTATNTWTARSVTNLPATFGTDGALCHPCTTYGAAASDDFIYCVGNNATTFYKYTISTNTWATGTAVTAAPGAGCALVWNPTYNVDKIQCIRGGATATVYEYTISTAAWATTPTLLPATETYTTGTQVASPTTAAKIYIQKDATMRIYSINMSTGAVTPQVTQYLIATGAATTGDRMVYVIETNGIAYLYLGLHTSSYLMRTPVWW